MPNLHVQKAGENARITCGFFSLEPTPTTTRRRLALAAAACARGINDENGTLACVRHTRTTPL